MTAYMFHFEASGKRVQIKLKSHDELAKVRRKAEQLAVSAFRLEGVETEASVLKLTKLDYSDNLYGTIWGAKNSAKGQWHCLDDKHKPLCRVSLDRVAVTVTSPVPGMQGFCRKCLSLVGSGQ